MVSDQIAGFPVPDEAIGVTDQNHEGVCCGGPTDGQRLISPRLNVIHYNGRRAIDGIPRKIGEYQWNGKMWVWRPLEAMS
jgi:hypothetical protein